MDRRPEDKKPFSVFEYSFSALVDALIKRSDNRNLGGDLIESKRQVKFLKQYFEDLGVTTFVVEHKYVDKHFLEDYAGYYSRAFRSYDRFCSRFHFFKSIQFAESDLENILDIGSSGTLSTSDICQNYLGFIVVKRLPQRIIGRTCLSVYPANQDHNRYFGVNYKHHVNLFGIELSVMSLPFQEQDRDVAACATSALWAAFHGAAQIFNNNTPSPVEITEAAVRNNPGETRSFPNEGLTVEQMAAAVRSVGLEPYQDNVSGNLLRLKRTVYAYLKGQIPLVCTLHSREAEPTIGHAVTISGYALPSQVSLPSHESNGPILCADHIDRLYVHDDNVGPYTKWLLTESDITVPFSDKEIKIDAVSLIIPLYHKIRLPFSDVVVAITRLDAVIAMSLSLLCFEERITWDVYITKLTAFRTDIFKSSHLESNVRRSLLTTNMPKFLWRAEAKVKGKAIFELLFDATDLLQGSAFFDGIVYDKRMVDKISRLLRKGIPEMEMKDAFPRPGERAVAKFFEGLYSTN